jgi:DNA-binding response OmpR family regulator
MIVSQFTRIIKKKESERSLYQRLAPKEDFSMRILIVEDEAEIVRFLTLELQHEGYSVSSCGDGRTGLEKALTGDFDLMLLDVMLPELNGMEVLRRLRKESGIPVILVTARDA